MNLIQILHEIEVNNLREDVFRALVDLIFKENRVLAEKNGEYKASLNAINKINKGKNEAIEALSDLTNNGGKK